MNETKKFYSAEEIQQIARRALSGWIRDIDDEIIYDYFREIVEEIAHGVYQPSPTAWKALKARYSSGL